MCELDWFAGHWIPDRAPASSQWPGGGGQVSVPGGGAEQDCHRGLSGREVSSTLEQHCRECH